MEFADNKFAGTTPAKLLPTALVHIWDYYIEIDPPFLQVDRSVDFNIVASAWAHAVGITLTRTELYLLKILYQKRCYRADNPLPPMQEATSENLAQMFKTLERLQKKPGE